MAEQSRDSKAQQKHEGRDSKRGLDKQASNISKCVFLYHMAIQTNELE